MTRPGEALHVGGAQFAALYRAVSNWGRWGDRDERGTLHHLTPERVAAAAALVRDGVSVSLSLPVCTHEAPDCPQPARHDMTLLPGAEAGEGTGALGFAKDYVGVDYHADGHSHIDALSHVGFDGALYNGEPAAAVTVRGASVHAIDVVRDGLVGRGVLLDIPRLRAAPWLEPGEHVLRADLEAAEADAGVRVREGDVVLVRTGHTCRLRRHGPWETATSKAGLHPTAVPFLAERGVAALGCDTNSDTAPSSTEGLEFPIHVLAINAMGLFLLDYLDLEQLRDACERRGRWEFLFVAAPLRIVGGTGSPINPVAVF